MLNIIRNPPAISRRRALTIASLAVVVVYILWNVSALEPVTYPFRLFVTYVHEAGHSLMAIITGGKVLEFTISADGSGLARTVGGSRALILPAGYVGAAFFGAALLYILNTVPRAKTISIILGGALIVFTLMFARPDDDGNWSAIVVGLLFGTALIGLGWKANADINLLVLNVLAIMTALNAVLDVVSLIRYADVVMVSGHGIARNDAAAFSEEIAHGTPPELWALVWAGVAVLMIGAAIYYSILRPIMRRKDPPAS
jgi:hypothetical protein